MVWPSSADAASTVCLFCEVGISRPTGPVYFLPPALRDLSCDIDMCLTAISN